MPQFPVPLDPDINTMVETGNMSGEDAVAIQTLRDVQKVLTRLETSTAAAKKNDLSSLVQFVPRQ